MNRTTLNVAGKVGGAIAVGMLIGLGADQLGLREAMAIHGLGLWLLSWGIAAGLLGWAGYARLVVAAAGVAALAVLLLVSTPIMPVLARHWLRADARRGAYSAVVVLSSGIKSDSLLDAAGTERLLTGIELQRASGSPRLVTTRAQTTVGGSTIATDQGQRRLLAIANVGSGWIVVDSVFSTHDEAMRTARLLPPPERRIALVTSPMHTRRACATFRHAGFDVTCVPAREMEHVTANPVTGDDKLAAWRSYLYERLAMVKYRWKGWVD